jgi:hypothetical protein
VLVSGARKATPSAPPGRATSHPNKRTMQKVKSKQIKKLTDNKARNKRSWGIHAGFKRTTSAGRYELCRRNVVARLLPAARTSSGPTGQCARRKRGGRVHVGRPVVRDRRPGQAVMNHKPPRAKVVPATTSIVLAVAVSWISGTFTTTVTHRTQ